MHSRCIHSLTFRAIPTSNTCLRTSYAQNVNIFLRAYHADFTPVKPLRLPAGHHSLLPLVNSCNNLILSQSPSPTHAESPPTIANRTTEGAVVSEEVVVPFLLSQGDLESPVGFLRSQVASAIEDDHQRHLVSHSASPWELRYSKHLPKGLKSVAFAEWVNEGGKYTRTMHMERIVLDWRKHGLFPEVLKGVCVSSHYFQQANKTTPGWSDEAYPVYTHPTQSTNEPLAFAVERAALPLFGLVNYGALLTGGERLLATLFSEFKLCLVL